VSSSRPGNERTAWMRAKGMRARSQTSSTTAREEASNLQKHDYSIGRYVEPAYRTPMPSAASVSAVAAKRALAASTSRAVMPGRYRSTMNFFTQPKLGRGLFADNRGFPRD
jgi:hypothetical protein